NSRPSSQTISYSPWSGYGDYSVDWEYDSATNTYLRSNGGAPHIDLNNDKQIAAKNVVILFMRESRANDGYPGNLHLLYGTTGRGEALVFQDGEEIEATWSKQSRTARTIITNSEGEEIEFSPGLTWFSVLPLNTTVEVK